MGSTPIGLTKDMFTFLDIETALITPACQTPPMACCTISVDGSVPEVIHGNDPALPSLVEYLIKSTTIVGHNVPYDLACFAAYWPHLMPAIFEAYSYNRVTDTRTRQQMIDIGTGHFKYASVMGKRTKLTHNLDECAARFFGKHIEGKTDTRLQYGSLINTPLEQWPQRFIDYARDDVAYTVSLYYLQEQQAAYLDDQYSKARHAWWLRLMANYGLRTSPEYVDQLEANNEERWRELAIELAEHGLARVVGKKNPKLQRNTKAAQARMISAWDPAMGELPTSEKTGKPSLAYEDLLKTEDDGLHAYAHYSKANTRRTKDIPMLRAGCIDPIHSRYDLVETERSNSSAPNTQNVRRGDKNLDVPTVLIAGTEPVRLGVRECFVPRDGHVFIDSDYGRLELCTFAQVLLNLFGQSRLANVLNQGIDPHTELCSVMTGIPYDEIERRRDAGDSHIDNIRNSCKVGNFGFPGGLGAESFVHFALSSYGVKLTIEQARELKHFWKQAWPETEAYFNYISSIVGGFGSRGIVRHHYTNHIRAGVKFTEACNSLFQGLGGAATKSAGYLLTRAMYVDTTSPLYGCRISNYIHDQFLTEAPIERAHVAALEQERLMIEGVKPFIPDIDITVDTKLSHFWSKNARRLTNENGELIPWPQAS